MAFIENIGKMLSSVFVRERKREGEFLFFSFVSKIASKLVFEKPFPISLSLARSFVRGGHLKKQSSASVSAAAGITEIQ